MRFLELAIQTQREAPSNSRTEGFAFLVRAGYLTRESQPLRLAQRVEENARGLYAEMCAAAGQSPHTRQAFFSRLGLDTRPSRSLEECFFSMPGGAEQILFCAACGYASRAELAQMRKPAAPAEEVLPVQKVLTPDCSTIEALANYLHLPKEKTAKAIMSVRPSDGRFVFAIVRGDLQMSEAKLRRLIGEVRPATEAEILAAGAVPGYASPVGLTGLLVIVDDLLPLSPNLVAGANQAGYHLLNVNYPRDFQAEWVADIAQAHEGDACPACGAALAAGAAETLGDGDTIRFERLLLPLAQTHHDEKGLCLPPGLAPFDVYLMNVPGKTMDTAVEAEKLYRQLNEAGFAVLFDDRAERAGVKFNDADLIGCPVRITVGERGLLNGMVELKSRRAIDQRLVAVSAVMEETRNELAACGS